MIDTREKRFSMMQFLKTWEPKILTPDGEIDQGDRQHLLSGYSGILWDAPTADVYEIITLPTYKTSETVLSTAKTSVATLATAKTSIITFEVTKDE